jgi:hypothetical protein
MADQSFWKQQVKKNAILNPIDRISEILFGLIMVLTFTGAISATSHGKQEISELLWGALGCNLAWGFVDAIMYLMNVAVERGHAISVIKRISKSNSPETSQEILEEEIQPLVASLMKKDELNILGLRIKQLPLPEKKIIITWMDIWAAFRIFLLVFICIFPVALPFIFMNDVETSKRTSNGIALLLLFIAGYKLAEYAAFRRLLTAFIYTGIGVLLVALTMTLGG